MLIIRSDQKRAFPRAVEENLECRLVAHAQRVFPEQCERMGEPAVRERVRAGMAAARRWGIEGQYDVSRYVDLLFLLGPDFGADDGCPWARPILADPSLAPAARLDKLYERAREAVAARRGPRSDSPGPAPPAGP